MFDICVDFDGTMVNHTYPDVGEPVPGAIEWCQKFIKEGCSIILWTMRSGKYLDQAIDFMINNDIYLYGVNKNPIQYKWTTSPKAYAQIYIDDAAACCPLIWVKDWERPCVDWEEIGMFVMDRIEEEKEYIRKLKMYDQRTLKKGVNTYTSLTPVESVPGLMPTEQQTKVDKDVCLKIFKRGLMN